MAAQTLLRMQHSSLQFSDSAEQQEMDISDLFGMGQQFPIKTGTEAGPDAPSHNMNRTLLVKYAKKHDHALHFARDNWIAVDRAIIEKGSLERGDLFIADKDETWGRGHDMVLCTVEFDHVDPNIGHVAVGAIHGALRGDDPGETNLDINRRMSRMISRWMARTGQGKDLSFVNGDFNINDLRRDMDLGVGNFTSMADELGKHPNTGHGPIDDFCSYDRDGRVKAEWRNVLGDKEFFQHSDHYVVRGAWAIRNLH